MKNPLVEMRQIITTTVNNENRENGASFGLMYMLGMIKGMEEMERYYENLPKK